MLQKHRQHKGKMGSSMPLSLCNGIVEAMTDPDLARSKHLLGFLCDAEELRAKLPVMSTGCFVFPTDDFLHYFMDLLEHPNPYFLAEVVTGFLYPKVDGSCAAASVTTMRGNSYHGCTGGLQVRKRCAPMEHVAVAEGRLPWSWL